MSVRAKINSMSYEDRLAFFCGGRVTTKHIFEVTDEGIIGKWVARIRGCVINSDIRDWRFDTKEEAKAFGDEALRGWREELGEKE